jgi:tellurite resistance protein TehA-like permease/glutaredoxin
MSAVEMVVPQRIADLEAGGKGVSDVTRADLTKDTFGALIDENQVMMFSKSSCAFCLELKRTLSSYGIPYAAFEVDKVPNTAEIITWLHERSGIRTFPNLFINSKSVGGCMKLKELEHKKAMLELFASVPRVEKVSDNQRLGSTGLFWFPDTVNRTAAQVVGLICMIYCILCVAFYDRRATQWAVLALAIDFFGRLLFGGNYTPIGLIGNIVAHAWKGRPVLMAGPPKQFAAFCGFFMSALSAALLLAGERLGGTIVIGILIFPTGLEGILDWCMGCWMFGLGIRYGIVPASVYRPYLNLYVDKYWAWDFSHSQPEMPEPLRVHVTLPGQAAETPIDLIRKDRFETEYKMQDRHIIKHARVDIFGLPMSLVALAYVYKLTSETYGGFPEQGNWGTLRVAHAIGITAAIIFCFFGILYLLRAYIYTQKVVKEWNHPVSGQMFSMISICLVLFGSLMFQNDINFGITLVWIGSCFQMFLTVWRVAALVYEPVSDDLINPSIMIAPVANFICAIGFAQYQLESKNNNYRGDLNYINLSRLWFAVASLFAVVLFAVTLNKAIRDHHSDARLRPTIFIWMATASVAGPSYFAVTGDSGNTYQCLWMLAIFFFAVNIVGYLRNFYGYVQDHSMFVYSFSYSALALSTFHYYVVVGGDQFTRVLAIISVALASTSVAVCSLQAVFSIQDGVFWRPRPKWGPVNFMKLTHEALRFGLPKLVEWSNKLSESASPESIQEFIAEFEGMLTTYLEHGNHEETVLFPAVRRYFPGMNMDASHDHEVQHATVEKLQAAISKWRDAPSAVNAVSLFSVLKSDLPGWATHVLDHLRSEEASISVVARKYIPLDEQKSLTNAVFQLTSASNWQVVMPWVLRNLPNPMWKVS